MTQPFTNLVLVTAALVAFCDSGQARACNVPVFRYALERWRPDPYRAVVFHRGPLSEEAKAWIDPLQERDGQTAANVTLRAVDVDKIESDADREWFASLGNPPLPFLVVQFPAYLQIETPIWSGPLDRAAVEQLTDSPVRRELVRRLIDGQTAVWLLLESGNPQKDETAAALLKEELETLQKSVKLPDLTDSVEDSLLTGSPLRVEFSLLRVPRNSVERALVGMLLQSEPDLLDRSDPMAFPVFGRGRAMFGLVGRGITAANIRDSAEFLAGACSCQIKEQNPGFDLLLAATWDSLISHEGIPPITSRVEAVKEPELVLIPRGSSAPPGTAVDSVRTSELGRSPALSQPVLSGWPIRAELAIVGCIAASGLVALWRRRRNCG